MKASSSDACWAASSKMGIWACQAMVPISSAVRPSTCSSSGAVVVTVVSAVDQQVAQAVRLRCADGYRVVATPAATNSSTVVSAISRPRPMTTRRVAVWAISLIRCDDTNTVWPSAANCLEHGAHPQHAFRVQAVDRLVEDHGLRVAEQRRGHAQPLTHSERESADPFRRPRPAARPCRSPRRPAAGRCRWSAPAPAGGCGPTGRCASPCLQQHAELGHRARRRPVVAAVDRDWPAVGLSSPAIIRIVVDLPAPLGPRNPVTMPGLYDETQSSTASLSPYRLLRFSYFNHVDRLSAQVVRSSGGLDVEQSIACEQCKGVGTESQHRAGLRS